MNARTILALAVAALSPAAAQQKVNIHRSATANVSVRLNGALGAIRVIGWDRDSIALTGTIAAGNRLDGGSLNPSGAVSGMKFYIEAADEGANGNQLELRVPRNARVWLKAGSARIDVVSLSGGLDLNVIGGSITVGGSPRELLVESMDAPVSVNADVGYGRVKTATGDITWSGRGDDIALTSVSGGVRVGSGVVQRARFESVTGSVTFGGEVARGGDARFDTHSGAIELLLRPQADVGIEASSITGTIENTFTSRAPSTGREGRGMELYASSGNASGSVVIKTFKGNVRIRLATKP